MLLKRPAHLLDHRFVVEGLNKNVETAAARQADIEIGGAFPIAQKVRLALLDGSERFKSDCLLVSARRLPSAFSSSWLR